MSYVLEGQRWAAQPISWDFAGSTLAGDQSQAFSNVMSASDAQAVVDAAFETWARAANVQFVQAAQDDAAVDIRIGWGSFTASGSDMTLGETGYRYYTTSNDFAPDVIIRLLDPSVSPVADQDGTPTYTLYRATLYQVALHEIGHALGLAHDPDDQYAIMYPDASTLNQQISAPDIEGIQAIYGAPAAQILSIGNNRETVGGTISGAPATIFGGSGSLDYAGNVGVIAMQNGSADVHDGIVTVYAGSGSLTASNNQSGTFVLSNGAASIGGGTAASTDIVFGGSAGFTYAGGQESATVVGGAGSATLAGGAGGGFYSGGSDGNNLLTATGIGSVLVGGGGNDILRANDAGYSYLVAGVGNETLVGAGGGTDRFYLGTGPDQVNLGSGDSQLVTGSGAATILGQGGTSLLYGGTGGGDIFVEGPNSVMSIFGFRVGTDAISGGTPASISVTGEGTVMRFSDGAVITLNGVENASAPGLFS